IALGSSKTACIAFAGVTNARAVLHTRRHLDFELHHRRRTAFAPAGGTGIGDNGTGATARRAGASNREESLLKTDLPTAVALSADRWTLPRSATRALAVGAGFKPANFDLGLGAEDSVFEVDGQVEAKVISPLLARGALGSAAHVEHFAEEIAENVTKIDAHSSAKRTAGKAALTTNAGMAEAIVGSALVRVAQHLVGLARLLESFIGRVVSRVAIGMVLERLLAICALKLLFRGLARDPQHFVVIGFAHLRPCSLPLAVANGAAFQLSALLEYLFPVDSAPILRDAVNRKS